MSCLETIDLVHHYSPIEKVLDHVNIQVEEGSIYGFLGPNGAGKTTTLKLILGLLKRQQGSITVFGRPFESNRVAILKKIGSLVETPSLYAHLTGYENLSVLRKVYQCPKENIQRALDVVGLSHTGGKKAGQFSLGMKQRLSIAMALLNDPSLLILDEPTNGLDPNGMIEIRELLRQLNKNTGVTIIISSHLLAEIEKLVTDVGIIHKGRIMFQGSLQELKMKQQQLQSIALQTSNNVMATEVISKMRLTSHIENNRVILPALIKDQIALLNRELVNIGVDVYEIRHVSNDLESIFMDIINN
ncbi:MAG TPA: ABC transporter ATP-binding protein [Chryseolinea sp.]|nr:ABC transporter ATP-binding protein [Chryseolinea sp.]